MEDAPGLAAQPDAAHPGQDQKPVHRRSHEIQDPLVLAGRHRHGRNRSRPQQPHQLRRSPRANAIHARHLEVNGCRRRRGRPRRHPQRPDSVHSAAHYLTKSGVTAGAAGVRRALLAYNPLDWYVNDILYYAARYGGGAVPGDNDCGAGNRHPELPSLSNERVAKLLAWAKSHNGDAYRMGPGQPPGTALAFTQAAYAQIGVKLPRTASAQRSWLADGNGTRIQPGQGNQATLSSGTPTSDPARSGMS